jgi:hypothetical protein
MSKGNESFLCKRTRGRQDCFKAIDARANVKAFQTPWPNNDSGIFYYYLLPFVVHSLMVFQRHSLSILLHLRNLSSARRLNAM